LIKAQEYLIFLIGIFSIITGWHRKEVINLKNLAADESKTFLTRYKTFSKIDESISKNVYQQVSKFSFEYPQLGLIIYNRYILGYDWKKVSSSLYLSTDRVKHLHAEALIKFRPYIN
jgi:hypothetical protein